MGLDLNGVRFILYAQKIGVNFENTAMIGRQALDLTEYELRQILKSYGYFGKINIPEGFIKKNNRYAEALLNFIGAKSIHSYDVSPYEGATHLHDMNMEISKDLTDKYTTVLDGGSLEHVFNFPVAIKNCMEMIKVGGHFLGITPANNFMGHGFYQFSPELYYSVFSRDNGFELVRMIAYEDKPGAKWYLVRDPKEVKSRIQTINNHPIYLLVIAKKILNVPIFKSTPQQSDYIAEWEASDNKSETKRILDKSLLADWAKRNLPFPIIFFIKNIMIRTGFNRKFFEPLNPHLPVSKKEPDRKFSTGEHSPKSQHIDKADK
jgi:hypothetical protein